MRHAQALSYHTNTVNVVRFSPDGTLLASGGDNGELVLWSQRTEGGEWRTKCSLRGHAAGADIFDCAWSPDGAYLISGSVDNMAIVWDVAVGKHVQQFRDHSHYVQGVAWDPLGKYAVTQSADRSVRVYAPRAAKSKAKGGPFRCKQIIARGEAAGRTEAEPSPAVASAAAGEAPAVGEAPAADETPAAAAVGTTGEGGEAGDGGAGDGATAEGSKADAKEGGGKAKGERRPFLFHDEAAGSFFRRLAWAPDGSCLVAPAGMYRQAGRKAGLNTAYVFKRSALTTPAAHLPQTKPAIAARFCRQAFQKGESAETGLFALPYRLLLAVASMDSVAVYDTSKESPLAVLGGVHLAPISDVAWSADGRCLAVSSQDGYCSFAWLEDKDLGEAAELDLPKIAGGLAAEDAAMLEAAEDAPTGGAVTASAAPAAADTKPTPAAAPAAVAPADAVPGGPRRIVPTMVAGPAGAAAAPPAAAQLAAAAAQELAPAQPAGEGQPAEKKRRIVPMLVTGDEGPKGFS